jgi:prepilin-type N-terminal cleavage/methylation domain-containing protein
VPPKPIPVNGFTLIELLVSLVVAALLMTILFDGLITSKLRSVKQVGHQRAYLLAENLLEQRRSSGAALAEKSGSQGGISWRITETVVAKDPRSQFWLIHVAVHAGPKSAPNLAHLERRFLRAVQ